VNIAKVVVDLPVREVNKEFDYLIPDHLNSELKLGQLVKVPFGRTKVSAFITGFKEKSELKKSQLKELSSLEYEKPFFDSELLEVFRWIAAYYHSYLIQVIKTALPTGITEKKVSRKKIKFVKISDSIASPQQILSELETRAPKQHEIFNYLLENKSKKIELKKAAEEADTSNQTVYRLIDKGYLKLYNDYIDRIPDFDNHYPNIVKNELNSESVKIYKNAAAEVYDNYNKINSNFLIKTSTSDAEFEFYKEMLNKFTAENKSAIFLIPEIEKDYILLKQLKEYYGDSAAFIHSQLSRGELFDEWRRIQRGEVKIVAGARSAVFAPLKNISLIIVKEENNRNYKQIEHPLYHARQVAAKRAKDNDAALVLTSDSPSVESRYAAQNDEFYYIDTAEQKLRVRANVVDLRKEVEKGNLSDISKYLQDRIELNLAKDNKILLFLNRRGYGNYVICKKCGYVLKCNNCDISLHYHKSSDKLLCHYCGSEKEMPDSCPECGSSFISPAGLGTESIVMQIEEMFEDVSVARLDSDIDEDPLQIIKDFNDSKLDILVSTQLILKNNIFDDLKLLGIISADAGLNSSDFRAAEESFKLLNELKLLLKNDRESEFVIQSFNPEHYVLKSAGKGDYESFYEQEIKLRKKMTYPPFCRLLNIIIQGEDEGKVSTTAFKLDGYLNQFKQNYIEKLGLSRPVIKKLRNKYRWQIILKFASSRNREYLIQLIEKEFKNKRKKAEDVEIRIDVDPYRML